MISFYYLVFTWLVYKYNNINILIIVVSETLEVDKIAEDILKLTLENSPSPSVESAQSQFGD